MPSLAPAWSRALSLNMMVFLILSLMSWLWIQGVSWVVPKVDCVWGSILQVPSLLGSLLRGWSWDDPQFLCFLSCRAGVMPICILLPNSAKKHCWVRGIKNLIKMFHICVTHYLL